LSIKRRCPKELKLPLFHGFTDVFRMTHLFAAIALANNLTLVKHNIREFGRVDGLQVEEWEVEV